MDQNEAIFYALTMKMFSRLRTESSTGKVILVSSARADEGKSFIAKMLAATMATLDDEPIALIDANLYAPTLHEDFGVSNKQGFSDCVAAGGLVVEPTQIGSSKLSLLPIGSVIKPGLAFKAQRVAAVLDALRERYRFSIIDASVLNDAGAMPHLADGVIMVVDASRTRREVIQGVLSKVSLPPEKMLGAILNKREQFIPPMFYRGL
jgi:Mrp family chromosome partitioning ATPase